MIDKVEQRSETPEQKRIRQIMTRSVVTTVITDPRTEDITFEPSDDETIHLGLGKRLEIPDVPGYGKVGIDITDIYDSVNGDAQCDIGITRKPVPHLEEGELYTITSEYISYLAGTLNSRGDTFTETEQLGSENPTELIIIQQKLEKLILAIELSR